jgi:hypothetical protein
VFDRVKHHHSQGSNIPGDDFDIGRTGATCRDQGSFCEDWFFSPVGESCFGPARRGDLLGTSRSCKKSQKVVLPIPPPKQILGGF